MPTQIQESQCKSEAAPVARSRKTGIPLGERAAFTPCEFASLFGRHQVWSYRLIYAGKLKVLKDFGRIMIPRAELDRLTGATEVYNPTAAAVPVR